MSRPPLDESAPPLEVGGLQVAMSGTPILHGADLRIDRGELVAVVGPNGAGKSTLARSAAGLQKHVAGEVRWMGQDVRRLGGRALAKIRAFVPQRPRVPAGLTVRDAVRIGRSAHIGPLQRATHADRDAVERALGRAGVTRFAERMLTTLSGGELQRVQIAVGLAQEAPVLMADEPTSHLDLGATVSVARLLRGLADDGLAVFLVVHDLALAAAVADKVVVMSQGRSVAAGPPAEVLVPERLAQVWNVNAELDTRSQGHTALRVAWLGDENRTGVFTTLSDCSPAALSPPSRPWPPPPRPRQPGRPRSICAARP
jgi:iron complex transport system ATP-binding protein